MQPWRHNMQMLAITDISFFDSNSVNIPHNGIKVVSIASVCLYVCMSVCLYVCLSVCLYVCMSVCLSVCMSVCLYVCLSVSVSCSAQTTITHLKKFVSLKLFQTLDRFREVIIYSLLCNFVFFAVSWVIIFCWCLHVCSTVTNSLHRILYVVFA